MKRLRIATPVALLALAALPAVAPAATTTSDVTGVVGTELSLAVSAPALMSFTPSTDGTSSSAVTITSTTSWTLTIADAGATTPGQMDKVDCVTRTALGGSLANALQWADAAAGTSGNLSATPATVATGSLVSVRTVGYTQPVGAAESVAAGDCYQLTATYTVS